MASIFAAGSCCVECFAVRSHPRQRLPMAAGVAAETAARCLLLCTCTFGAPPRASIFTAESCCVERSAAYPQYRVRRWRRVRRPRAAARLCVPALTHVRGATDGAHLCSWELQRGALGCSPAPTTEAADGGRRGSRGLLHSVCCCALTRGSSHPRQRLLLAAGAAAEVRCFALAHAMGAVEGVDRGSLRDAA